MTTDLFIPPAAEGLPIAALDSATEGADRLDAAALTPTGRNFLAHALVQLARDGWLRAEPDEGFEPVRVRQEPTEPAAAAAVPPPDRDGLRKLIAGALSEARRPGLGGMTEADAVAYMADAVLPVLPDTARLHDEILTLRADQAKMRDLLRKENERANSAIDRETTAEEAEEEHRLALSDALGLGTSAPWDAIRERAAELAAREPDDTDLTEADVDRMMAAGVPVQIVTGPPATFAAAPPAPVDRAAALRDAADLIEARQDRLDAEERAEYVNLDHETVLQGEAVRSMAAYLRKQAAGTPGPETQATAEPWLTDSARIGRTLIWSWADVGKGAFREGYRAAQAEARALLGGERGTDQQQPAVTLPGKECAASVSDNCLAEAQSETGCATEDGECVHAGQPGKEV